MTDLCAYLGVFPGEPIINWLRDKTKARNLFDALTVFMRAFGEAKTLKRISRVKNTLNPFAYNGPGDDCCKSLCCNVFRHTVAQLTVGQYNHMLSNGLFDPSHTIGQHIPNHINSNPEERTSTVGSECIFAMLLTRVHSYPCPSSIPAGLG
ncbi:hypothetical protein HGRIS_001327 [Hohenbuehelia grisea]|uniref:Uncharacterized protein n=1 Tax=Hohenbuehelia grisea TaxID=104357 RepID=A0ABR3JQA4_9AGAR